MSDYARGVLHVGALILAPVALWAALVGAGYVLIDVAVGWPS